MEGWHDLSAPHSETNGLYNISAILAAFSSGDKLRRSTLSTTTPYTTHSIRSIDEEEPNAAAQLIARAFLLSRYVKHSGRDKARLRIIAWKFRFYIIAGYLGWMAGREF